MAQLTPELLLPLLIAALMPNDKEGLNVWDGGGGGGAGGGGGKGGGGGLPPRMPPQPWVKKKRSWWADDQDFAGPGGDTGFIQRDATPFHRLDPTKEPPPGTLEWLGWALQPWLRN